MDLNIYTQEEREIIKRYHKYVKYLWGSDNTNLPLIKPEKFNFQDEMSVQWLVLTVLSIQDDVRKGKEIKHKLDNTESKLKLSITPDIRLALIAYEESKHKFLSERYRHEYAVKIVDEYLSNL